MGSLNTKWLFTTLIIVFMIVLIIQVLKVEKKPEQFRTCYNMCKGKDQWACGRKCDFVQKLYGGEDMTSVQERLGYLK